MLIEYNQQKVFICNLDVVDPGNTCIHCLAETGEEYFIIIKSFFGKVNLLKVGPVIDGFEELIDGFNVSYMKFDYKESTILKIIQSLVNDPKKKINLIEEILPEEAYDKIPNVVEQYLNCGE